MTLAKCHLILQNFLVLVNDLVYNILFKKLVELYMWGTLWPIWFIMHNMFMKIQIKQDPGRYDLMGTKGN